MIMLYMFPASLTHHQEFKETVCSQVSYSIILDSVFCLSCAASVQGFVGPGMVCDGCPLCGARCGVNDATTHLHVFQHIGQQNVT